MIATENTELFHIGQKETETAGKESETSKLLTIENKKVFVKNIQQIR